MAKKFQYWMDIPPQKIVMPQQRLKGLPGSASSVHAIGRAASEGIHTAALAARRSVGLF